MLRFVKTLGQNHYFVNLAEILQPKKECYLLFGIWEPHNWTGRKQVVLCGAA
jgi:hypothetical protein